MSYLNMTDSRLGMFEVSSTEAMGLELTTQYNAGVGHYASHSGEFSLSATYHM